MAKTIDIIDWLRDHPLLSLNAIEKQLDLPQGTLSKALKGSRDLPVKHQSPLAELLKSYGYPN